MHIVYLKYQLTLTTLTQGNHRSYCIMSGTTSINRLLTFSFYSFGYDKFHWLIYSILLETHFFFKLPVPNSTMQLQKMKM